jgi:hypothetical protein
LELLAAAHRQPAGELLFERGDFVPAQSIYTSLLELSTEPGWRLPLNYQIALCHERLGAFDRARLSYRSILEAAGKTPPPELAELTRMAAWRLEHLDWRDGVDRQINSFRNHHRQGRGLRHTRQDPFQTMSQSAALSGHQALCDQLHALALEENRFLRTHQRAPDAAFLTRKRELLAQLDASLAALPRAACGLRPRAPGPRTARGDPRPHPPDSPARQGKRAVASPLQPRRPPPHGHSRAGAVGLDAAEDLRPLQITGPIEAARDHFR